MNTMPTKDYSIPLKDYPHLDEGRTLHDAIKAFRSFTYGDSGNLRFRNMLVVSEKGALVGRIGLREVLAGLEPRFLDAEKGGEFEGREGDFPQLAILWEDSFLRRCLAQAAKPLKEFLSPVRHSVQAGDSLLKTLYLMQRTGEEVLPVLEDGKVYGVVRIGEVFSAICDRCGL